MIALVRRAALPRRPLAEAVPAGVNGFAPKRESGFTKSSLVKPALEYIVWHAAVLAHSPPSPMFVPLKCAR